MTGVQVRFLGSGDAFGHGGRLQACIEVQARESHLLLDCGATSAVALARAEVDPDRIDAIVVSHFHGDHFGGIPYFILDAQFRRRSRPLTIAGPPGIQERVHLAMESAFAGSSRTEQRYPISYQEIGNAEAEVVGAAVAGSAVDHTPGSDALGLRVRIEGVTIAYSGDTAWTDALVPLAAEADLFICEAYSFEKAIPYHLSYKDFAAHRSELAAAEVCLTHLGPEALTRRREMSERVADDGMLISL